MANIDDIIQENIGLVYSQLNRFNLVSDQDAESFAYEALYKAAVTYDAQSGTKFSTYAVCCISNAIRLLIRHRSRKRQLSEVSYNTPVNEDEESLDFIDIIVCNNSAEDAILNKELGSRILAALRIVYGSLSSDTAKRIFIMWYKSDFRETQQSIAATLKISQPAVSRHLGIIKYKLRQELEDYL